MNKVFYLENTNLDTTCDSPKWRNYDLTTKGPVSGSLSVFASNTSMVLTAAFIGTTSTSVGSFATVLTSSVDVVSLTGPVEFQFRISCLSGCTRLTSSNFSLKYDTTGVKNDFYPVIWLNTMDHLRFEVYLKAVSGSATNININTTNSFVEINPFF